MISLIPYKREYDVFRNQLSKSVTSIGANYQESQAASYAEFRQRIQICLRESRETVYWIKLLKESIEIKKIFGTIYNKVKVKS